MKIEILFFGFGFTLFILSPHDIQEDEYEIFTIMIGQKNWHYKILRPIMRRLFMGFSIIVRPTQYLDDTKYIHCFGVFGRPFDLFLLRLPKWRKA